MADPRGYALSYSDQAVETVTGLARYPHLRSDYVLLDPAGRDHHHVLVDGFVIAYLVDHADHADRADRIIEINDVRDSAT